MNERLPISASEINSTTSMILLITNTNIFFTYLVDDVIVILQFRCGMIM